MASNASQSLFLVVCSLGAAKSRFTLLTLESKTIVCCVNAKAILVRQLLLVFIPTCQRLVTNTRPWFMVTICSMVCYYESKFLRVFCNETLDK